MLFLLQIITDISVIEAVDNGVAATPPMGWCSWMQFKCEINCTSHPTSCINADLYKTMADHLFSDGYAAVGYTQINIDDCWNTKKRNSTTNQQMADPKRFPNGIKSLADYVHNYTGLKLGLYNDIGSESCKGYTGIDGHYELDAQTFANWEIDMIKIDGCHTNVTQYYERYPKFGQALNATGRPIIYACSWPSYVPGNGETNPPQYNTTLYGVSNICNTWRNHHVGQPPTLWDKVVLMIEFCTRNYNEYYTSQFLNVAGPYGWNDPDQIFIGESSLSIAQQQTQFVMWAIFAAPLLMSNDLRNISNESKVILLNKEVIDVNQDPLGKQGGYIWMNENKTNVVWMRELYNTPKSLAIVLQNGDNFTDSVITFSSYLVPKFVDGWNDTTQFAVRDLLNHKDLGIYHVNFSQLISPNDVGMYTVTLT